MKYSEYSIILAVGTLSLLRPSWSFVSKSQPVSILKLRNDLKTTFGTVAANTLLKNERLLVPEQQLRVSLQASSIVLPSIQTVAMSCLLPTCLGYIRYEYGVSYGYGSSVAIVATMVLGQLSYGSLAYWHALALVFYGVRLNLFLLYRELCIPRFRKFRETIEERRTKKGNTTGNNDVINRFISRTPFVIGCAALYAGLVAPLLVSSQSTTSNALIKICIASTWFGFVLAAIGDLQKSFIKATLGEDVLVKGTLFSRLRHPNYTGEALAWTASFLTSIIMAATHWKNSYILPLLTSTFGWIGIIAVLTMAATGLEKKQFEKYKDTKEYQQWVKKSWAGPTWGLK